VCARWAILLHARQPCHSLLAGLPTARALAALQLVLSIADRSGVLCEHARPVPLASMKTGCGCKRAADRLTSAPPRSLTTEQPYARRATARVALLLSHAHRRRRKRIRGRSKIRFVDFHVLGAIRRDRPRKLTGRGRLTEDDRAALRRWKLRVRAIVAYQAPQVVM